MSNVPITPRLPEENDDFLSQEDDSRPVTRGEVRKMARSFRQDLKWFALVTVVANQTLSHVQLPTTAGFIGGAAAVALGVVKLWASR